MSKEATTRPTRDDTEHGVEYYLADQVDALLAEQPAPMQQEQELVTSAAKDAIMGAAYDFRDAHLSGSTNLKRNAHAVLVSTVESALAQQPAPRPVQQEHCIWARNGNTPCPHTATPQRKPLTDKQFLELLLKTGTTELVSWATFVGGSIQMQGKIGLLRGAKLLKEFVEAAHGIKDNT